MHSFCEVGRDKTGKERRGGYADQVEGEIQTLRAGSRWGFCLSPSLFRSERSPEGSFRFATRFGLDTAAFWSRCPMTATWLWPRWRSIPSSWWRTWTRALAHVSATQCPAGASPIKQEGTQSNANTLVTSARTWRFRHRDGYWTLILFGLSKTVQILYWMSVRYFHFLK